LNVCWFILTVSVLYSYVKSYIGESLPTPVEKHFVTPIRLHGVLWLVDTRLGVTKSFELKWSVGATSSLIAAAATADTVVVDVGRC